MKQFVLLVTLIVCVNAFPQKLRSGVQPNSKENIEKLKTGNADRLPWMLSGQFEGDIVLTEEQIQRRESYNGVTDTGLRWPNNTIPYVMDNDNFTWVQQRHIRKALDHLELLSCLKFVERTNEVDYLQVTAEDLGCYAYVGRLSGPQQVNLAPGDGNIDTGCIWTATIQHEFLHAIGFYHMQSTYDRDNYVDILWRNIYPGSEYNFEKFDSNMVTNFGVEYDYSSVMHYDGYGFSVNGEPTIVSKKNPNAILGQNIGLTRRDVERLNAMYNCPL